MASYVPEEDHRQTLYIEYLQLIADHAPDVFVMENVKGLLSATLASQRLFLRILEDLSHPGAALHKLGRYPRSRRGPRYRIVPIVDTEHRTLFDDADATDPRAFVIRSERFGVPQARHRVILMGIREGSLSGPPVTLSPSDPPTVSETLADLPRLRSGLTDRADSSSEWRSLIQGLARAPWLRDCPVEVSTRLKWISERTRAPRTGRGAEWLPYDGSSAESWGGQIPGVITNHSSRAHMSEDLKRYFFASVWADVYGKSPTIADFPELLLPRHRNVPLAMSGGHFADRFRVQVGSKPATTVTSHIAKDGHYYIHYEPQQCRSLTVREAARLQTFPDDYLFVGPRTSQYQQVGNAVPPHLARQIARIVATLFD